MAYKEAIRLTIDYESPPPAYGGLLKRWNGTAWVNALLKVYLSGSWQTKPLRRWNGNEWLSIEASG